MLSILRSLLKIAAAKLEALYVGKNADASQEHFIHVGQYKGMISELNFVTLPF